MTMNHQPTAHNRDSEGNAMQDRLLRSGDGSKARNMSQIVSVAGACQHRVDHGVGTPLTFDQALEAVAHPLDGLPKEALKEIVAYLTCQLIGARRSINADAALAMVQIESIVREFETRNARTVVAHPARLINVWATPSDYGWDCDCGAGCGGFPTRDNAKSAGAEHRCESWSVAS